MDSTMELERILLYSEKEKMTDFGMPEEVNDELYKLFLITKDRVLEPKHSSSIFFNEVFSQITRCYVDHSTAEHIEDYFCDETSLFPHRPELYTPDSQYSENYTEDYEEHMFLANRYVFEYVWLILSMQRELPKHMEYFVYALDNKLNTEDNPFYQKFKNFYKDHPAKIDVTIKPDPSLDCFLCFLYNRHDWEYVTRDFHPDVIKEIVYRFSNVEDRRTVLEEIKKYLAEANADKNRHYTFGYHQRATASFLDELYAEAGLCINNEESVEKKDTTVRYGFEAYIIKDHKRVMDILMLVANMGKAQMPLLIKFIKAFQSLGYIKRDCFDNYDQFLNDASEQFCNVCFDKANVKRNIEMGCSKQDNVYEDTIQRIAYYLTPVLRS